MVAPAVLHVGPHVRDVQALLPTADQHLQLLLVEHGHLDGWGERNGAHQEGKSRVRSRVSWGKGEVGGGIGWGGEKCGGTLLVERGHMGYGSGKELVGDEVG